jgi:hypothetical protein
LPEISSSPGGTENDSGSVCNHTTRDCIFPLDTTSAAAQNPGNFFRGFLVQGTRAEKIAHHSRGGEACSICRDGLCSASIRNVRRAATGCVQPTPEENAAAIAALRSTMFRLRWAHACGCVPVRWAVTARRAVHPDGSGSRRERVSGPLVPVTPGRAVPATTFPKKVE